MKYRFHPFASQEADDALAYYQTLDRRLGTEFVEEFESAIARILAFPEAWQQLSGAALSTEPFPVWNSLQASRF